jgi:collagenase-like PrtC family protease
MSGFAIPADFRMESIAELERANAAMELPVREVYGCLNPSPYGSGRRPGLVARVSAEELRRYVECAAAAGIEFNYTLNFSSLGNREYAERGELRRFVEDLAGLGVRRFTVALPTVLDVFADLPEARVTISTILAVQSPVAVRFAEQFPWVDRLCVPESLNRDLPKLARLCRGTRLEISTIVNSFCLLWCPFRAPHYDYESHPAEGPQDYLGRICDSVRRRDPAAILGSPWIRPEELDRYIALGVGLFKFSGREMPGADFMRSVRAYNTRRYDGDVIDLLTGFSAARAMYALRLDNRALDGLMPRILGRGSGCHPLYCDGCGVCSSAEAASAWSLVESPPTR